MDVDSLRAQIPALKHSTYLNSGTFGPAPSVVTDEIVKAYRLVGEYGGFSPVVRDRIEFEGYEQARARVASLLNVAADEVALTRSTSDGICTVAYGLNWQPGDQVVITDQEHASGEMPWINLHYRYGVDVQVVRVAQDPSETLRRFGEAITPRTRLVFASHVSCTTGERLPVGAICSLARERDTWVAIDGAHAPGQFPVDLQEIEPDFYITCGHKWLLGPQGTSMMYIARRHIESLKLSWTGWGAQQEDSEELETLSFQLFDSARRFEFATKSWPLFLGLDRSIQFVESVGLEAIQARVGRLSAYFKEGIERIPGLTLLTPMEPERCAGLVSVVVEGHQGPDLRDVFWDRWRILTSSSVRHQRVRFSVAFFTLQEELDLALEALSTLASEVRAAGHC